MRITESYLRNVIRTTLKGVLRENIGPKHRFDDSPDEPLAILKDLLEITEYYEEMYEESEHERYDDVHDFRQQIDGFITRLSQFPTQNQYQYMNDVNNISALFQSLTSTINESGYIETQINKLKNAQI